MNVGMMIPGRGVKAKLAPKVISARHYCLSLAPATTALYPWIGGTAFPPLFKHVCAAAAAGCLSHHHCFCQAPTVV